MRLDFRQDRNSMAKHRLCLALAGILTVVLCLTGACSGSEGEAISAKSDPVAVALEEALASGKPTVAGFVGRECDCKDMRPVLEDLEAEYEGVLNVVVVDVSEHKDLAGSYEIVMTPTEIIFDGRGAEITRYIGFQYKETIVSSVEDVEMPGDG